MTNTVAKACSTVLLIVAAACGGSSSADTDTSAASTVARGTEIERAVEDCIAFYSVSTAGAADVRSRIGDNGNTVTFDTMGEDDFKGDSFELVACALKYLEVTDFIIAQIDGTRALDGTQQAEWGDYRAVWTYHPDAGLVITVGKV